MAEMSLLLSVATSLFRSGWGDDEALLDITDDKSGLRGSGNVVSESDCNPDVGERVVTVAIVGIVDSDPDLENL